MNPKSPEEAIFSATLSLPPDERAAYLEKACGDDIELRRRVEILLNAHAGAAFLEEPAAAIAVHTIRVSPSLSERPGDHIGRYKLLQQIGEGGCGVVYMAEQEEPVSRRVALKIIKLGMDTKQVIARFEAERQALAMMDHPNIAKVLDGGATETGRPYFVMELVRGVKITDYCDQNNLATAQRLELFLQVCRAVQHAHSKGIIHRDLKPSNILVTLHDGVPIPKVIDFGIAKATQGKLTNLTLFTAFEQFMGTPAYMSPEQAEMSGLDIDTRSDIYSLGVLLYELLTGKTPFDAHELIAAGLDALRQTIREKEPARPSTKLSTMVEGDLRAIAKQRQTEPLKLISTVRGDLDWIVMKCLEKDRSRRYETANDLGTDLQRHLSEEPVKACPPSNAYRLRKLIRRNKLAFAAAAAVLTSLLAGLAVSLGMYVQERAAKQNAQVEAQRSEQVARFLKDTLEGVGPSVALGRDTTILREILGNTEKRLRTELTNQPAVQADLLSTIGQVYRALTLYTNAENYFREALNLRVKLWGETNQHSTASMDELGMVLAEQTRLNEGEPLLRKALAIRKQLLGPSAELATSICNVGELLQAQGKYAEGEDLGRQSLEMRVKLLGKDDLQVAESLHSIASALYYEHKNLPEAEKMNLDVLEIRKRHHGELHPGIAMALNNLGTVYQEEGKETEAESAFRQCAEQWRKLMGQGSAQEGKALHNLSWLLCNMRSDLDQAEALSRKSLEMRRRVLGPKHNDIGESLNMMAIILQRKGDYEQAEKFQREHLEMTIAMHGTNHPVVVASEHNLAVILRSYGKFSEAQSLLVRALELERILVGPTNSDVAQLLQTLATVKADQGLFAEAEQLYRQALDIRRVVSGKEDAFVASAMMFVAHTLCQQNKFAEAESPASRGTKIMTTLKPEHWIRYNLEALWGRSLAGQTNYPAAEPLLLSGVNGMQRQLDKIAADKRVYFTQAVQNLAQLYDAMGKTHEAAQWRDQLSQPAEPSKIKSP